MYTTQKLLNNTRYQSFKDLAFVTRRSKDNIKIFQDVFSRPDIYKLLAGLDDRQKLGFLQLQALVGMSKFNSQNNTGHPITLETNSHGIIRKTFLKLTELGYLQNYEETYLKDSHLILPKLAFGNTDIKTKVPMYNMRFRCTEKPIDFDDPDFKKMFPLVFARTGILEKQGYEIQKKEDGELYINFSAHKSNLRPRKNNPSIRDNVKVPISLKEQRDNSQKFLSESESKSLQEQNIDSNQQLH